MDSLQTSRRAWVAALLCLVLVVGSNVKLMASQAASGGTAATSDIEDFRALKTETPHTDSSLALLTPPEDDEKDKDVVIEEDIVVVEEDNGGASTVAAQGGLTGGAGASSAEGPATQRRGRSNATVKSSGEDSDTEDDKKAGSRAGAAASPQSAAAAPKAALAPAVSTRCEPTAQKNRVLKPDSSEIVYPDSFWCIWGEDALSEKDTIPSIWFYRWPHCLDRKRYEGPPISYHFRSVDIDFPEMSYPGIESSFIKTKDYCISPYEIEWAPDANRLQDIFFLRRVPQPLLRYLANRLATIGALTMTEDEREGKTTPYPLILFLRKNIG